MKRIKRDTLSKGKSINIMEPIPFDKLGSKDDPCFGKLHSLTSPECSSCGDSEICSIIYAQLAHSRRLEIESKNDFKDIKNLTITWKELSKSLSKFIKPGKSSTIALVRGPVVKSTGISDAMFDEALLKLSKKSSRFKVNYKTNKITNISE